MLLPYFVIVSPSAMSSIASPLQHHGGYDDETDTWNPASSLVQFRDVYVREL